MSDAPRDPALDAQASSSEVERMSGWSNAEAARILQADGYNELPATKQRTALRIALEVVREPMFLLLLAAGSIYLILGASSDAAMLLAFVVLAMSITIYQERKTERVLEALRDLSSPRALVIRDGQHIRIAGREVVKGDLLVLEEGDRVAADGILHEAHDLLVDESLLTGESFAVAKLAATQAVDDDSARVYSGSMVVQGGGLAVVGATGAMTEIGRIGKALQEQETERSPLQREIGALVKRFSIIGAAFSFGVVLVYGLMRGGWLDGLLVGISLAMSILPEEFTLILAIFMALGAWRISKSQVLTRRTPVIETLGTATVLCVDKTGTLTENRMSVNTVVIDDTTIALTATDNRSVPAAARRLIEYATLASEIAPFDPMDKAFHRSLTTLAPQCVEAHHGWELVHEYPLASDLMAMTHVWRVPGATRHVVAVKGAPEAVARLCRLNAQRTGELMAQVRRLARQGMRVLAVAEAVHEGTLWPDTPHGFSFQLLGLVGLADPLRPGVREAVGECSNAGIRVVMITGDHPVTAQAIARDAGLPSEAVITGIELDVLSDDALQVIIGHLHVFARIRPEQKLRLVNAFKAGGDIVAMTGDGVNDAPALKAAHIGISMGQRGTDVAREASSLVLLNDDFSAIVQTIRLGRRIYDNLRKAMTYVVAVHLPIAGMTLLPLLFGTPLAMAPVHIVFLEMIINPSCSIVFEMERAENDVMQRPPRPLDERLFGKSNVAVALLQGVGLLAATAAVFFHSLRSGLPEGEARAAAFSCLVLGNLILIIGNRSSLHSVFRLLFVSNRAQWWMLAAAGTALLVVLHLDALRQVFHFAPLHSSTALTVALAVAAAAVWLELVKAMQREAGP